MLLVNTICRSTKSPMMYMSLNVRRSYYTHTIHLQFWFVVASFDY